MAQVDALAQQVNEEVRDGVTKLSEVIENLRESANRAQELASAEKLPTEFVGVVVSYRYGMEESGDSGMPRHTFNLNCGAGLWLHVNIDSGKFDDFLVNAGMSLFSPTELEGKLVKARRDADYGAIVPIEMMNPIGQDMNASPVFIGVKTNVGIVTEDITARYNEPAVLTDRGTEYFTRNLVVQK